MVNTMPSFATASASGGLSTIAARGRNACSSALGVAVGGRWRVMAATPDQRRPARPGDAAHGLLPPGPLATAAVLTSQGKRNNTAASVSGGGKPQGLPPELPAWLPAGQVR
jgi:hypothetical protein